MSDCHFEIPVTGQSEGLFSKAKQAIEQAGGEISGDSGSGLFSIPSPVGKISGSYTITTKSVSFTITDKPFFVSCGLIEGTIRQYLGITSV